MASAASLITREGRAIRVRGLVQGVGFRPTVWRLARECGMAGSVWNDAEGVMIEAWGERDDLDRFLDRLEAEHPPLARIDAVSWEPSENTAHDDGFTISPSRDGDVHTGIVPDAASCVDCLAEICDAADRRHRYPFTNCTHCGPRLSIVEAVPYDRANTSMAVFDLCDDCRDEYENPEDRRFHAQPTACPVCGPVAWLESFGNGGSERIDALDAVAKAAELLRDGAIVAIKGLGGFHLACDATDEEAVTRLRKRKRRYGKPFALMARNLEVVRRFCTVGAAEQAALASTAAPIVILETFDGAGIARSVAPGQATLGFILPYTPLHHLLMQEFDSPLVMTSGNLSEEPQCTDNDKARASLSDIADYALLHDRIIVNRLDDSVVRMMAGELRLLRRARGYAPAPIALPEGCAAAKSVLAMGGELKSSFCLVADGQAILSQHLGDLEDAATFDEYRTALSLYSELFDHRPEAIAIDRHPDYLSSKLGGEMAEETGIGIEPIQHHHAHIASCLAENNVALDTAPVLGIALDGLGYGDDGALWGGEFLLADYCDFRRLGRFAPVAMPGGAQAVRQPWRNAYAHLRAALGWEQCRSNYGDLELVRYLETKPLATLDTMARKGINSPLASSCGRLFDAVAAAAGICRDAVHYEGQAAIELEALVDPQAMMREDGYPVAFNEGEIVAMDWTSLWQAILDDLKADTPASMIAARFHKGLAQAISGLATALARREAVGTIALSGGSFQNRILLECVGHSLKAEGLNVVTHRIVPANDGGLSLGQAAIAAARQIATEPSRTGEIPLCA